MRESRLLRQVDILIDADGEISVPLDDVGDFVDLIVAAKNNPGAKAAETRAGKAAAHQAELAAQVAPIRNAHPDWSRRRLAQEVLKSRSFRTKAGKVLMFGQLTERTRERLRRALAKRIAELEKQPKKRPSPGRSGDSPPDA